MGREARARGTFEERKAAAIERDRIRREAWDAERQKREAEMTVDERMERNFVRTLIHTVAMSSMYRR